MFRRSPYVTAVAGRFRAFEDARAFVRSLQLHGSEQSWRTWSASGARPTDIPSRPDRAYRNCGWSGVHNWLGMPARPHFKNPSDLVPPTGPPPPASRVHRLAFHGLQTFIRKMQERDPCLRFQLMPKQSSIPILFRLANAADEPDDSRSQQWVPLLVKSTFNSRIKSARFFISANTQLHESLPFVGLDFAADFDTPRFFIRRDGFPKDPIDTLSRCQHKAITLQRTEAVDISDVVQGLRYLWDDLPRRSWHEWLDNVSLIPSTAVHTKWVRTLEELLYQRVGLDVSGVMQPNGGKAFNAVVGGHKVIHRLGVIRKCDASDSFFVDLSKAMPSARGGYVPLASDDDFDFLIVVCPRYEKTVEAIRGIFVFSRQLLQEHRIIISPAGTGGVRSFRAYTPTSRPRVFSVRDQQRWQVAHYVDMENLQQPEYQQRFLELFSISNS